MAFGEKVQFIFGYELSFVVYNLGANKDNRVGIVFDYDGIDNVKRLHVGIEYMYRVVGLDVGPTFAWKDSKLYYGFSVIPFGGLGILPYINYTNIRNIDDHFDFGAYIKIPIPFSDEGFKFGG